MACAAGLDRDLGCVCLQFDDMHLAYQGVKCCPAGYKQALIKFFSHELQQANLDCTGLRPGYVTSGGCGGGEGGRRVA